MDRFESEYLWNLGSETFGVKFTEQFLKKFPQEKVPKIIKKWNMYAQNKYGKELMTHVHGSLMREYTSEIVHKSLENIIEKLDAQNGKIFPPRKVFN